VGFIGSSNIISVNIAKRS